MSTFDPNLPVCEIVRGNARRPRVQAAFRIDFCCDGRVSLEQACAERGLNVAEVARALEANDNAKPAADQVDWLSESMTQLADHILSRHHTYLRAALPQLGGLLDRVVAKHADQHRHLVELREIYRAMQSELLNHMMKEELVLFPFIRLLDEAAQAGRPVSRFHCGSVTAPIQVMEHEHQSTGKALRRMRELTLGFQAPAGACDAHQMLMAGLRELETDLHLHIHKENDILFPRAAAVEASQSSATAQACAAQH